MTLTRQTIAAGSALLFMTGCAMNDGMSAKTYNPASTVVSALDTGGNPMVGGAAMYPSKNIVENAVNSADHTTLVAAVKAAGLVETLSGPGPFTVFAPTNAAFDALPAGTVENLLKPENKDMLTQVLTYHVVGTNALSSAIGKMIADDGGVHAVPTVSGGTLLARMAGDMITLQDENGRVATVTVADVRQSNGVIHVVDTVLLPNMGDTMAKSGGNPMVGGAEMFPTKNIVENAVNSADHTTLVAAVKAAGLVDTLSGPGPFTVFAPTNAAFEKLPAGTVETLLKPENKAKLSQILTYHVVSANAMSDAINQMIADDGGAHLVRTVAGGVLLVRNVGGQIAISDEQGRVSYVTIADVQQSNGVIHVIDNVLLPAD